LIKRSRGWELPERLATPEHVYLNRRQLMLAAGAGAATVAVLGGTGLRSALGAQDDPSAHLYPVKTNEAFKDAGRAITDRSYAEAYNNYYEFTSSKSVARAAQALPVRPWDIRFDGEIEKPFTIGIDELLAKMPLEER